MVSSVRVSLTSQFSRFPSGNPGEALVHVPLKLHPSLKTVPSFAPHHCDPSVFVPLRRGSFQG